MPFPTHIYLLFLSCLLTRFKCSFLLAVVTILNTWHNNTSSRRGITSKTKELKEIEEKEAEIWIGFIIEWMVDDNNKSIYIITTK